MVLLNGAVPVVLLAQYPLDLLPESPRLHQKQYPGSQQDETADHSQGERPARMIVLPIGHPVPAVAVHTEYDDSDDAADRGQGEIGAGGPEQQLVLGVLTRAAGVEGREEATDEQESQAESEEELGGHEEVRQDDVVDDVVILLEDPPAAVEARVVHEAWVAEAVEADLPEAELRELGIAELAVGLEPVGRGEGDHHQDEAQDVAGYRDLSGARLAHVVQGCLHLATGEKEIRWSRGCGMAGGWLMIRAA